ncbi:hypothetical protein [Fluviicola sp.]|jgi:hypothetical protein|uniref:hypothetical protein n=1 Tax=Fluviicola sp. TaxID=1917219 RepID=UPI002637B440|nr:hypothetical protein [Fluviicola sp.]
MEKMKLKNLFMIGMMVAGLLATTPSFAANEKGSIEGNRYLNRKEYKDMKATMSRIEKDRERIAFHKSEFKKNKEAGLKIESHMSKKELRKAKADLKRDKKYLRIDKCDLHADQSVAIHEANSERNAVKKELRLAKKELRKDIRQENTADLKADVALVETLTLKEQQKKQQAEALKDEVYAFFIYLDDEIDEVV